MVNICFVKGSNIANISLLYVVSAIIYRQKSLDEVVHWYFGVFRLAGPSVGEFQYVTTCLFDWGASCIKFTELMMVCVLCYLIVFYTQTFFSINNRSKVSL